MGKGDVLVRMKADTTGYDANIARARRLLEGFKKDNLSMGGVLKQLSGSLVSMAAQYASVTAAVGAFTSVIRGNIETARNFEKSMSQLSSLTGMVGADLNKLKEYSIELGSSTTLSASQVADAFKLIGSQQPQLLASGEALKAVTKNAITLAEAAGIELAEAAKTLSVSINQMGGDSSKAERYVNVLAAASQKGAGDIAWLGEAITKSGTTAKAIGTDYEELVANLEQLAKAGYDASTAGTALRSIIMNLEKKAVDEFKPSVVGLTQAFENLGKANLSLTEYQDIAGKMFASQAKALAEASGEAKTMREAITGTNTAMEQAKTNTDNLDGSLKSLASAWEGLSLHINSSNGLLRDAVDWLTELIRTADQAFITIGDSSMWETYKTGLKEGLDVILQTIGPLSTLVRMVGLIGGNDSGDKPLGAVIGSIVPKAGAPAATGGTSGGGGGAGGGSGKTNKAKEVFGPDTIGAMEQYISELQKKWKAAGDDVRELYAAQIEHANEVLRQMKGEAPVAGSVAALNEEISRLQKEQEKVTSHEGWEELQRKINSLKFTVKDLQDGMPKGVTFSDAIHRSVLAENEETKTHLNDKNFIGDSMKGLDEKVLTTIAERQAEAAQKVRESWKTAASAVSTFGNVLSSLKSPAAQIGATVAQAIASVALAYADTLAKDKTTKSNIWAFIAASAAAMVSMATTISTIHSSTGYAEGGVIPGNSFSGDNQWARVNAGETILTQAQAGNLASRLQDGNGGLVLDTELRGDNLRIMLRRGNQKHGHRGRTLVL